MKIALEQEPYPFMEVERRVELQGSLMMRHRLQQ